MSKKKNLVLSGINLHEGGPLSIYVDLLNVIHELKIDEKYHVIAFVYSKELFRDVACDVEYVEIPEGRKSYFHRFYYEYVYFHKYSKTIDVDIWFSLHDMTPNVVANKRIVYCHNPSPFLRPDKTVFKYSKSVFFMSLLYKYIYKINIKKNDWLVVQQDWMRNEFKEMYGVENVIVARPTTEEYERKQTSNVVENEVKSDVVTFIFASYPRVFKNFEVILNATKILEKKNQENFKVLITLDGTESIYSKDLRGKFNNLKNVEWMGLLKRETLLELYNKTDCMIFPSKLETWGLPISEYKETKHPMLLADLPYAHETIGTYDKVAFFDPYDAEDLSRKMEGLINGDITLEQTNELKIEPYCASWKELILKIM